jgi:hypothetical protein
MTAATIAPQIAGSTPIETDGQEATGGGGM